MSNADADTLAALGLTEVPTVTETVTEEVTAEVVTEDKASREEVEVGEITVDEIDFIPQQKRLGDRTSKYKFGELKAPVDKGNGKKGYSRFVVELQPGVDAEKLRRSVQSATTAQNRQAKAEGSVTYFITRSYLVDGVFKGLQVIRTDARPEGDAEEAA
jgi:hypothetical protein